MNDENVPDSVRCGKHQAYFVSSVLGQRQWKEYRRRITMLVLTQQCNRLGVDPRIRGKSLET
jgi:hypothetical protein